MKKSFLILVLIFISELSSMAQRIPVEFMGIPVDGTKTDMINALKEKGFMQSIEGMLEGEFNGIDVYLVVNTTKNKVDRIALFNRIPLSEEGAKVQFNALCDQFESSPKYIKYADEDKDFRIPMEEDVSYQILVNHKRYEANFCQKIDLNTTEVKDSIQEEVKELLGATSKDSIISEERIRDCSAAVESFLSTFATYKRNVWFLLSRLESGKYNLLLFYDNEYNRPHGEDL